MPFLLREALRARERESGCGALGGCCAGAAVGDDGHDGSASVSGTIWLTQDRCDGTFVRVTKDNQLETEDPHFLACFYAPGWIRTSDIRIRSPMLYPAELRGLVHIFPDHGDELAPAPAQSRR